MNLKEAFEALLQGKKIRYKNDSPERYFYLKDSILYYKDGNVLLTILDTRTKYEEYKELTDFQTAIKYLTQEGHYAKRKGWEGTIYFNGTYGLVYKNEYNVDMECTLTKDDVLAKDWILL